MAAKVENIRNWREQIGELSNPLVALSLATSLLRSRADIAAKMGTTFGGMRKHYEIFGWPTAPDYTTFEHLYKRGGIAKRIVAAYPQATWRTSPVISEKGKADPKVESPFEKAWKELAEKRKLFHYLERVDRMARLGVFSILFLGYSDSKNYDALREPVGALTGGDPTQKLLYVQPFSEGAVQVKAWETNPGNERFGKPTLYGVQLTTPQLGQNAGASGVNQTFDVHWSRVLHVAEDVFDSDLEGSPALEPVLNMLLDLEKTFGSAAESFFQQNPPLTFFGAKADAVVDETSLTDESMQDKIDDFIHGYKRWLALQGFDVSTISPTMGDPSKVIDPLLDLIAGTTGIPKRILIGSERGELASTQDETAWNKRNEERQHNWAEPFVLRPLIDELVAKGVLPPPGEDGYDVEWGEQMALGEEAQSKISLGKAQAIAAYAAGMGTEELVPPEVFLREVMGFSEETIEKIAETRQEVWDKELEDLKMDDLDKAAKDAEATKKKNDILGIDPGAPPAGGGFPSKAGGPPKPPPGGKAPGKGAPPK